MFERVNQYEQSLKNETQLDERERRFLENFKRHQSNSFLTLLGLYKGHYSALFLSIVFFVIKHSPVWVFPIVTANIINVATAQSEHATRVIVVNLFIMLIFLAQNVLTNYIHTWLYAKTIRQVEKDLRGALVHKLQQLSISYHQAMQSGRLQSKIMRDVEQIENLSSQIFITILSIALNMIVAFGVVMTKSFTVFLFFILTIPIAAMIIARFRGKIRRHNTAFRKELEETSAKVMEMVELIPVARAHALEKQEMKRMNDQLGKVAVKGLRLDMIQTYFSSISWVVFQVFQVLCLAFTGYLAATGKISVGEVVLYQTYFSSIVAQVSGVITLLPTLSKGLESVDSVGDILLSHDIEDNSHKKKISEVKGEIGFNQVTFTYPDATEPVLENLAFEIKQGETVAFVGGSGAGKTTILNLVIGFLKCQKGEITIDGEALSTLNLRSYREHIAVVPQTAILFTGTIKENITYGMKDVSEERLMAVIQAANLEELIKSLPEGWDTMITEHGSNLSGGQRQRIAIARAFIRDPKILILDEATSALDSISEKKIQEAITRLVKGRTTLVVAHRLSTIRGADKIAVIGNGGLEEVGSYETLMQKQGEFYKLQCLQA